MDLTKFAALNFTIQQGNPQQPLASLQATLVDPNSDPQDVWLKEIRPQIVGHPRFVGLNIAQGPNGGETVSVGVTPNKTINASIRFTAPPAPKTPAPSAPASSAPVSPPSA